MLGRILLCSLYVCSTNVHTAHKQIFSTSVELNVYGLGTIKGNKVSKEAPLGGSNKKKKKKKKIGIR